MLKEKINPELLCYCHNITKTEFTEEIWENSTLDFYGICQKTQLGSKCTSCALNAEVTFVEANASRPPKYQKKQKKRDFSKIFSLKYWENKCINALDFIIPSMAQKIQGIAPILAAENVKTVMCVANSTSKAIGPKSSLFRVKIKSYDSQGNLINNFTRKLNPGERIDFEASKDLPLDKNQELTTGSVWAFVTPLNKAWLGTMRPHFKVYTEKAVSAVHTQAAGWKRTHIHTNHQNPQERQFISLINCDELLAEIKITVTEVDNPDLKTVIIEEIPPMGAKLVEIPHFKTKIDSKISFASVLVETSTNCRFNMVVCGENMSRISLDHL